MTEDCGLASDDNRKVHLRTSTYLQIYHIERIFTSWNSSRLNSCLFEIVSSTGVEAGYGHLILPPLNASKFIHPPNLGPRTSLRSSRGLISWRTGMLTLRFFQAPSRRRKFDMDRSPSSSSSTDGLAYRWSIIIGLIFIVLASLVAWFFSPKGENQTYAALILSLSNNYHIR